MIKLVFEQAFGPEFLDRWDIVIANNDQLKGQVYDLRCRSAYASTPNKGIDAHDAYAQHLLLCHRDSNQAVATTRVIPKQSNARHSLGPNLPIEGQVQPQLLENGLYLPKQGHADSVLQLCELSQLHILNNIPEDHSQDGLAQVLTVAGYALARLLFQDVMLCELTLERFKLFRARGLPFEYASALADGQDNMAVFYLELQQEIRSSSPYYELYQWCSGMIAHQLNMPEFGAGSEDLLQDG